VKEGDFTMVFGYPGTTAQYVSSYYIDMMKNHVNPRRIAIWTKRIEIMEDAMATDPLIRIQYYTKKAGIANGWKKSIGEIQGLEKMNTIGKKEEYEARFMKWVSEDNSRMAKYGNILPQYKELYTSLKDYYFVNSYTNDVFNGAEVINHARGIKALADLFEQNANESDIQATRQRLITGAKNFYKNYNSETDKKLFVLVMKMYGENMDQKWQVPEYIKLKESCKGDFQAFADKVWEKSVFTNEARYISFVNGFTKSYAAKLKRDPFYLLGLDANDFIAANVRNELMRLNSEVQNLNRLYMTAQMEFDKERVFYPDANSTLRVAYGQVKGYRSRDAVYFTHYTTLGGIMEKDNPEIYDYDVPDRLKELYRNRDFGRYTQDGEVPVCFIANNHTTGGNSGSPVINAEGHLIGINFDRAWEGVASDLAYNPDQSRNISLDIRYALFLIDKFAGAGYLLKEMKIIE
jgi:hypothetical protein